MANTSANEITKNASGLRDRVSSNLLRWRSVSPFSNYNFRSHRHDRTLSRNDDNLPTKLKMLYDPPSASIDLVFVHGLGGDLEKSWRTKDQKDSFWPQDWLRKEEALRNVRVHTFGYPAAFTERDRTALDITGLSSLLLKHMDESEIIGNLPIIFIAHSMGGLITKQAFLYAQTETNTNTLHSRIRGMIFLATPHQGSDWPILMEDVLRVSLPLYLKDLSRGSEFLANMNRNFRSQAHQLQLSSFYELRPTPLSRRSSVRVLVVDPSSAKIDLPHEKIMPLDADHRQICKFSSTSDKKYQCVRDAIVTHVECILEDDIKERERQVNAQMRQLASRLNTSASPVKHLEGLLWDKMKDSCGWVLQHDAFLEWRKAGQSSPAILWLTGNPGTGKSILSAHVIEYLQNHGENVCYYFCLVGRERQRTSDIIRHLAFQMAEQHPIVREALLAQAQRWETVDKDDARLLWKHLFTDNILSLPLDKRQIWIIDGLNESITAHMSVTRLFNITSKSLPAYPINLFLSSRTIFELQYSAFPGAGTHLTVDPSNTREDINRYIIAHSRLFDHLQPIDELSLRNTLESKADGCFLWLKLVVKGMEEFHSTKDKLESLEDTPESLNLLYRRILDQMETKQHERVIGTTRAILTWVAHAVRDLHQKELRDVILKDLGKDIEPTARTVEGLCGQLIRVQSDGIVRPAHFTITEFLQKNSAISKLTVGRMDAHERLATVCLEYLSGPEFRPPRAPELPAEDQMVRSSISEYASTSWSRHVMMASSGNDDLVERIHHFLTTNVLSWLEFIVRRKGSLYEVIQTAKNLRNYLDRRAKHVSPISKHYSEIDRWITDLLRVSAKFGKNLLSHPSTIHFIVPALCPKNSSIHTAFSLDRGISLKGAVLLDWDDCISYTEYLMDRPSALACSKHLFAIGLTSEYVKLFDSTTLQETASLHHEEPVMAVLFDSSGQKVVSAGWNTVRLWTVCGDLLWKGEHAGGTSFLAFSTLQDSLLAITEGCRFSSWRISDGLVLGIPEEPPKLRKSGKLVVSSSMSDDLSILAVAFATGSPEVWSLKSLTRLGKYEMNRASALQILLNPRTGSDDVAITYNSSTLAIFGALSRKLMVSVKTEATVLASTPDGLTLATGDRSGNIKLWDFETLRLMYCISSPQDPVNCLTFSLDGLRLFDLRGTRTMVWEPSVLVRKNTSDNSTVSESVHEENVDIPTYNHQEQAIITAMLVVESLGFIIVGKQGGTVCAYDITTGVLISILYSHGYLTHVAKISFSPQKNYLATADNFSVVLVKEIKSSRSKPMQPPKADIPILQLEFKDRARHPIRQISFSPDGSQLLVHHSSLETLHLSEDNSGASREIQPDTSEISCFAWIKCSDHVPTMIAADSRGLLRLIRYHVGKDSTTLDSVIEFSNHQGQGNKLPINRLFCDASGQFVAVELKNPWRHSLTSPAILVYRARDAINASEAKTTIGGTALIKPIAYLMARSFSSVLGYWKRRLVFVDANLWIRSYNLAAISSDAVTVDLEDATRHMFVTNEIAAASNSVPGEVTLTRSAIFSKRGEIAVIHHALDWDAGERNVGPRID